jgi:hypothetical protein
MAFCAGHPAGAVRSVQGNMSCFREPPGDPDDDHRASATRIAIRYFAQRILDLKAAEGCRSR